MEEILGEYGYEVGALTLIPGSGGVFEVKVDDQLVFSKEKTDRFPNPGELKSLVGPKVEA